MSGPSLDDLIAGETPPTLPKGSDNFSMHQVFGDIKPLKQDTVSRPVESVDEQTAKIRRHAAEHDASEENATGASSGFVHMVEPNAVLSFRRDGVQPRVLNKLKNGEYREAAFIDLHKKTVEEAYEMVMSFLEQAQKEELRCILIVHGKGERNNAQDKRAVLKSFVNHWLKQIPEVLAFHSAPSWKGGSGALMVILKKSDEQKAANREKYSKRRQ